MKAIYYTLSITWKEIKIILKDRTWLVILFLLPLLIGGFMGAMNLATNPPEGEEQGEAGILLRTGLVNLDTGDFGTEVSKAIQDIPQLEVTAYSNVDQAQERVVQGDIISAIILSASMPETGGMYVYLREGWGRPYGFLYGWAQLVLIRAAALGGISSVFGEYFMRVFGLDPVAHPAWADYLAAGAIVFAGVTNIVGVQFGALFAGNSTITKFGALSLLVVASVFLGGGVGASWGNLAPTGAAVDAGGRSSGLWMGRVKDKMAPPPGRLRALILPW